MGITGSQRKKLLSLSQYNKDGQLTNFGTEDQEQSILEKLKNMAEDEDETNKEDKEEEEDVDDEFEDDDDDDYNAEKYFDDGDDDGMDGDDDEAAFWGGWAVLWDLMHNHEVIGEKWRYRRYKGSNIEK